MADLRVARSPDNGIICGLRSCQVYAVHSRVVAQVLALLTPSIHKGQVACIYKWLESLPATISSLLVLSCVTIIGTSVTSILLLLVKSYDYNDNYHCYHDRYELIYEIIYRHRY